LKPCHNKLWAAGGRATRDSWCDLRLLEDEYGAFSGTKALNTETLLSNLSLALCHNSIDFSIRMARVVMEEYQAFDVRLLGDL
jgi:hypothetical protein